MMDNRKPSPDSPFRNVTIGTVVTTFGEKALRVHHARFGEPPPIWFSPDTNKAHGASHLGGFSVYWQSEFNEDARNRSHPFETEVMRHTVSQLSLLH